MNKRSRIDNVYRFYEEKQDLQKIQDLEKQIEKLSLQNKEMKYQLENEEYEFCVYCNYFTYKEYEDMTFCEEYDANVCLECEDNIHQFKRKMACNRISRNPIFDNFLMRKVYLKRLFY